MKILSLKYFAIIFIVTLFMLPSCSLKEKPDFSTEDQYFANAERLQSGLTAVYDGLNGNQWFNLFYCRYVFECRVGYQVGWEKGPLAFQNGDVNPADEYIKTYWNTSYDYINKASTIIKRAETFINQSQEVTANTQIKAEAMVLRAFYYYYLVCYFDNIPVKNTATNSEKDFVTNENGKQRALDLMESDLTFAKDNLPEKQVDANVGRVTKWAAMTLLMKAYLQGEQWKKAYDISKEIIDKSGLKLFQDFEWNFSKNHENEGERIMEVQISASKNSSESSNHHVHYSPRDLPTDLGGVSWGWVNGTLAFRRKYTSGDKRIPGTFLQSYPSNMVGTIKQAPYPTVTWKDPADYGIINDSCYKLNRTAGLAPNWGGDRAKIQKDTLHFSLGIPSKWLEIGMATPYLTEKNIVFLRYADVLLGNSEAANEGGIGDPYIGINEVRNRADLSALSGLDQQQLRDSIVNERMLEFAFENGLYPELKRKSSFNNKNGKGDYLGDYIKQFIKDYKVTRTLTAKDYVFPIPQTEVLSNSLVKQNPEY